MTILFNTALGGLTSNAMGIQVVANNVANLNTDGFRSNRFDPATGSVTPRFEASISGPETAPDSLPPSDVDLATELVDLKRFEIGYRANATVVTMADRMLGEMLDLLG